VKSFPTIATIALIAGALAGCAYRPLKAPCSPDEGGTPLAYSGMSTRTAPDAFKSIDRCGPMRPI
jgi:hypothetical protein